RSDEGTGKAGEVSCTSRRNTSGSVSTTRPRRCGTSSGEPNCSPRTQRSACTTWAPSPPAPITRTGNSGPSLLGSGAENGSSSRGSSEEGGATGVLGPDSAARGGPMNRVGPCADSLTGGAFPSTLVPRPSSGAGVLPGAASPRPGPGDSPSCPGRGEAVGV